MTPWRSVYCIDLNCEFSAVQLAAIINVIIIEHFFMLSFCSSTELRCCRCCCCCSCCDDYENWCFCDRTSNRPYRRMDRCTKKRSTYIGYFIANENSRSRATWISIIIILICGRNINREREIARVCVTDEKEETVKRSRRYSGERKRKQWKAHE